MPLVDVVDEKDNVIKSIEKSSSKKSDIVRCVVVFLLNDKNEILLQLRSKTDDKYPSHWDCSAGGHLDAGEDYVDGAKREMLEEIGVKTELEFIDKYLFKADGGRRYFSSLFKGKFSGKFKIDPNEGTEVKFFSKSEIEKMIEALDNPKHKVMISLLYASGVRVSELVTLKIEDIDLQKRLLKVCQGKGQKDRYTILSKTVVEQIRKYIHSRPYQSRYLFASSEGHVTIRTVEEVLKQARHKAKMTLHVTPHSLRHSFATHHMEQGTKTEYIQQMLGHKDIRTTRIYEHISTKHLENIKSPQDNL